MLKFGMFRTDQRRKWSPSATDQRLGEMVKIPPQQPLADRAAVQPDPYERQPRGQAFFNCNDGPRMKSR